MRQLFDSVLDVGIITFCEKYGESFIRYLSELKETGLDTTVTCELFKKIQDMVLTGENRKEYLNGDTETAAFDVFYAEGFIPSYSFPKNVVRFYVEDPQTTGRGSQHEVKYAPERDIAVAISEYAPDVLEVRDEYRAQNWAVLIRECQASGLTKKEFCRQRGVSEKSFYYWLRKLREQTAAAVPELVPLNCPPTESDKLFVRFKGAEISVPAEVDMDAVTALLKSIQSL